MDIVMTPEHDAGHGTGPFAVYAPRLSMRFDPLGDRAILVGLGGSIDEATHRRVRAAYERLAGQPVAGVIECVPAFTSVCVYYDPTASPPGESTADTPPYDRMVSALREALADLEADEMPTPRLMEIPVCYGGEMGPDLEDVARHHGISPDEVVRIHTSGDYLVHMIGFAPGFPYLGGLPERIATPRRATPRTVVPASSVGIGGRQTGIYPNASPGGWHLIGRTPLRLFVPEKRPPSLLQIGDRVRFRAIGAEELRSWQADA